MFRTARHLPGVVGQFADVQALLYRARSAAVAVDDFLVYPDCVEFRLRGRTAPLPTPVGLQSMGERGLSREYMEQCAGLTETAQSDFVFHVLPTGGAGATFVGAHSCALVDRSPGDALLEPTSGPGSLIAGSWTRYFRLSPLPPAGPMTLVIEWPSRGIASGRAVIDATSLHRAKDEILTLWPEQPGPGRWHTTASRPPSPLHVGRPGATGYGDTAGPPTVGPQRVGRLAELRAVRSEVVYGPQGREGYVFVFHGFVCDAEAVLFRLEVAQQIPRARCSTKVGHTSGHDAGQIAVRVTFSDGESAVSCLGSESASALARHNVKLVGWNAYGSSARGMGEYWQQTDDLRFTLTPLPLPGLVELAVAWPEVGIPESHTVIDAQILRQAAEQGWQL